MCFDYECWNLDSVKSKPIDVNNLEHWQKSQRLVESLYETWKKNEDKKVEIDGVKYRLVPLIKG